MMALMVLGHRLCCMPSAAQMTNGHLGLLMLALIVVAIMLGFPTAFTLMGMGVLFAWLAYRSQSDIAIQQTLDLMVQRTYGVMSNDVLISIPLFVFMGYLVERANLIDRLFKSLHLATARVPGSLAVATIITCAIFATATGIVGAVVTLMGLLAFPAMLKAGYNVKLAAGAVTAGGCLGILIPPSVLLIVYGATAGVSVVQLYAGAFFPGIMLAGLYLGYVIVLAKLKPALVPPLSAAEQRRCRCPRWQRRFLLTASRNAVSGLLSARAWPGVCRAARTRGRAIFMISLLPALAIAAMLAVTWHCTTVPDAVDIHRQVWSKWAARPNATDTQRRSRRPAGTASRRRAGAARRTLGDAATQAQDAAQEAAEGCCCGRSRRNSGGRSAGNAGQGQCTASRCAGDGCLRRCGCGLLIGGAVIATIGFTAYLIWRGWKFSRCCWGRFSRWRC